MYAPSQQIHQVIYTSEIPPETREDLPGVLAEIVSGAIRKNVSLGVTGMLLTSNNYFLQLLEGQEDDVEQTIRRIMLDYRHDNVQVIHKTRTMTRVCPEWHMCAPGLSLQKGALSDILHRANFSPDTISGAMAARMFEVVALAYQRVSQGGVLQRSSPRQYKLAS